MQENIGSLINREREDLLYPEYSGGISADAARGLSFAWNLNSTAAGFINSFSVSANVLPFMNIRGGYSRETGSYSSSLSFVFRKISFAYGFRFHPYLGGTHSISVTLTGTSPVYESMSYRKRSKRFPGRKVKRRLDISKCTLEELESIPVINDVMAKRIISYRKIIGPVSIKSLYQIGMTGKDVKELMKYIYGLSDDAKRGSNKKRFGKKRYTRRNKRNSQYARKQIFERLLLSGISAVESLNISKLAVKGGRKDVLNYLKNNKSISPGDKTRILKICSGSK